MAKHAVPSIPDSPEKWLDEFSTFSIYQVLPKIIELWGLNVQTAVESKNLDKLFEVIDILANGGTLDAKYRDHDLTGNYRYA